MGRYYIQFAQTYGEGDFGACLYSDTNSSCGASTGSTAGTPATGGSLSDTGLLLIVVITLACVIAFVALLVRFWRRPARRQLAEEVVADPDYEMSDQDQDDTQR